MIADIPSLSGANIQWLVEFENLLFFVKLLHVQLDRTFAMIACLLCSYILATSCSGFGYIMQWFWLHHVVGCGFIMQWLGLHHKVVLATSCSGFGCIMQWFRLHHFVVSATSCSCFGYIMQQFLVERPQQAPMKCSVNIYRLVVKFEHKNSICHK